MSATWHGHSQVRTRRIGSTISITLTTAGISAPTAPRARQADKHSRTRLRPATPTHVVQVPAPPGRPVRLDALVHRQLDDLLHGQPLGRAVGAEHLQRSVLGGAGLGALLVLQ